MSRTVGYGELVPGKGLVMDGEEVGAQPQPHEPREVHSSSGWWTSCNRLGPHKHKKFTREICKIYTGKHRQKTGEGRAKR